MCGAVEPEICMKYFYVWNFAKSWEISTALRDELRLSVETARRLWFVVLSGLKNESAPQSILRRALCFSTGWRCAAAVQQRGRQMVTPNEGACGAPAA